MWQSAPLQERFKLLEKEIKTKAFSHEGLKRDLTDPQVGERSTGTGSPGTCTSLQASTFNDGGMHGEQRVTVI